MKKIGLALFILLLVYAATGWFLAPRFADKALREFASERLGLELRFENLLLYPFGFSAHLENIVVLDRGGRPLFTASAIDAQSGPIGFWSRSALFTKLVIDQPVLHVTDAEAGRVQVVELLARLSAILGSAGAEVQIDELSLREARIVRAGGSDAPPESITPFLNLEMANLGGARSGPFYLTFESEAGPSTQIGGEMTWQSTGPAGTIRFRDQSTHPPVPSDNGSNARDHRWVGLSIDAPFSMVITDQGVIFQIRQAKLDAGKMQLGLQSLAVIRMEDVSAGFDLEVDFGSQGLVLREASAHAGKSTLTGLAGGPLNGVEVAIAKSGISFSEFALRPGQAIPFDMRLSAGTGGEIQLAGQYRPPDGSSALVLSLQAVPMHALFRADSGLLPQAIAGELLTAKGRLQLSQPFASLALSGVFASGAELSISGMSQYEDPLQDSRFELELTGLGATSVSPWVEAFAGRRILSGTLGARLAVRMAEGDLAGRYELSANELRLQESDPALASPERDPNFLFALMQDSDRHIEFTVPLDGRSRVAGTGFADWLGQEAALHLSERGQRPFDTLARVVGADSGTLRTVSFQAGQAGLSARAVAQLEWLKTALQWRPGLALRVSGGYDPEADRYALASQQVLLHVNLATAVSASERANSAPVDFADPKAQSVLDEFAGSRLGRERVEAIWRNFQLTAEGADASLAATDNIAFYRALFDALVDNEQIPERALLSLARFRARTVIDQLANSGVDRERLESGEPEAVRSEVGTGVPTGFELKVNRHLSGVSSSRILILNPLTRSETWNWKIESYW